VQGTLLVLFGFGAWVALIVIFRGRSRDYVDQRAARIAVKYLYQHLASWNDQAALRVLIAEYDRRIEALQLTSLAADQIHAKYDAELGGYDAAQIVCATLRGFREEVRDRLAELSPAQR
jgi:hypothetical protein